MRLKQQEEGRTKFKMLWVQGAQGA
jgi:hypothetical protein